MMLTLKQQIFDSWHVGWTVIWILISAFAVDIWLSAFTITNLVLGGLFLLASGLQKMME